MRIRKWLFYGLMLMLPMSANLTGCAARVVYVRTAPPPPRVEVRPPRPAARAVWIPGHWRWTGHAYVWVSGRWELRPKGRVWVPGHWRRTRRGWMWVPGHWKK